MDVVVRQVEVRQAGEGGEDEGMEDLEVVEAQVELDQIVDGEVNIILSGSGQGLDSVVAQVEISQFPVTS